MRTIVRIALLAGAAYALSKYWQSGRSPLLADAGRQRPDETADALEPLGATQLSDGARAAHERQAGQLTGAP